MQRAVASLEGKVALLADAVVRENAELLTAMSARPVDSPAAKEWRQRASARLDAMQDELTQLLARSNGDTGGMRDAIRELQARLAVLERSSNSGSVGTSFPLFQLLTPLVAFVLGAFLTPMFNRQADRRKYTLQVWEEYIERMADFDAAQTLLLDPAILSPTTLTKIQTVRAWMSAVASFALRGQILDRDLIAKLGLTEPFEHFVDVLRAAVTEAANFGAKNPSAPQQQKDIAEWARANLQDELDACGDISDLCRKFHT